MGYIIVIAQLPGLWQRKLPSDSGRFTAINPWPHAITITRRSSFYMDVNIVSCVEVSLMIKSPVYGINFTALLNAY